VSEHGNLVVGKCALDTIRIVTKTIIIDFHFGTQYSAMVPVGGAQRSKVLVIETAQIILRMVSQGTSESRYNLCLLPLLMALLFDSLP